MLVPAIVAALFLSAAIGVVISAWAWRRRDIPGTTLFSLTIALISFWSLSGALEVLVGGLRPTVLVVVARWTVAAAVPPLWVFFSLRYTGRSEADSRGVMALLATVYLAYVGGWWTNGTHHLLWGEYELHSAAVPVLVYEPTLAFWAHHVWAYALVGCGLTVLLHESQKSRSFLQEQATALVLGTLIVIVPHLVGTAGVLTEPRIDLTGLGLTGFGLLTGWSLYRYELFGFAPLTRNAIMESIDEAVYAFDHRNRLVDVNRVGREILADDDSAARTDLLGRPAEDVLPEAFREFVDVEDGSGIVTRVENGESRHYSVRTSRIPTFPERFGVVLVVNDVTARIESERRLEVKNEQLDRFVGAVSHDLRNPLQTASGYAELARQTGDAEHFDELEASLERMERIIDDALELARSSEDPETTEWVDLEAVARDAWSQVSTDGAALVVDGDVRVLAHASRLQTVFENLFRNAVEHGSTSGETRTVEKADGGPDLTIRVHTNGDEFVVGDDGKGIDADEPSSIFEHGFTTNADGTGYGLSIVKSIADAHGWTVDVGSSPNGGAQFTFGGVSVRSNAGEEERSLVTPN